MFGLNAFGQFSRPMDEADGAGGGGGWQSKTDPESGYTTYSLDGVRKKFGQDVYSNPNIVWGSPSLMYGGEDGTTASDLSTIKTIGGVDPSTFKATYSGDRYYTMGQNGPEEAVMLQDGSNAIIPKSLAEQYLTPGLYRSTKDVQDTSSMFEKMMPMAAAALVTYLSGGAGAGVANSLFGSGALAGAGSGALAAGVTGQNPVYGAVLGGMKGALPSMGGTGGVGDSVSGSSVYDPTMSGDLLNQTPSSLPTFSGEGGIPNIPSTSGGLAPGDVLFPDPTINTATPSLAQQLLNSGIPLPQSLQTALQTGKSLLPFANQIRSIIGTGSALLGGSAGTPTSGATKSPSGLPGTSNALTDTSMAAILQPNILNNMASKVSHPLVELADLKNMNESPTAPQDESGMTYAAEGGGIYDYYKDPKFFPKFDSAPSMLPGSKVDTRPKMKLGALKNLQSNISTVGGLSEGGLPKKYAEAAPKGHDPEFITGLTGYYASGGGTGQSDDIPAMLHDGDYVMDADVVSSLGDGSSKAGREILDGFRNKLPHKDSAGGKAVPAKIADGEYVFPSGFVTALGGGDNKHGAKILDGLREKLRQHKRSAPANKIPPKAKSPLDYIAKG